MYGAGVAVVLGRALVAEGLVASRDLEAALYVALLRGVHLARALIDRGALRPSDLERALERPGELFISRVAPVRDLYDALPRGLCKRLYALPIRLDGLTRTVDVATLDPLDAHVTAELGYHLGAPIRVIRAPFSAIDDVLRRLEPEAGGGSSVPERPPAATVRRVRATPAFGTESPSTHPPAREHERPIPLVRKPHASMPPAAVLDDEPVLPLRHSKVPPSARSVSLPPPAVAARGGGASSAPPSPLVASGERLTLPDASLLFEALAEAPDMDAIVRIVLRAQRQVARRVGVFAVRRDGFRGYACNVELGDPDAFKSLQVPFEQPSVLATAVATGFYLGPIPRTKAHESLLELMETASPNVAVAVARARGVPAMMLLADELVDTLLGTRRMSELATAAGDAMMRLLKKK